MNAYLFVHFKEKSTPDGEQVYFAVSTDGFNWEQVNGGEPVLWSVKGDKGVRDHTIVRTKNGKFYILATDLSLANGFDTKYKGSWINVGTEGSKHLSMWESDDLVNWSEQKMIELGDEDFGCIWAPDVIYESKNDDYVIHWSSSHASNNYGNKAIFYTRTKDFQSFTKPQILCRKDDSGIIDSAIYEEDGMFYRFLKSEANPTGIILEKGKTLTGAYSRIEAFDEEMAKLGHPAYEAPTAFKLADGRWCLMIDFFGVQGEGQGYVPFIANSIDSGKFIRSDESFSFPYRFKHGTVLSITMEEYSRIKQK
ncbi:glycoside hydrolase family 43 protein [Clostridium cellulovorans]|uniref:Glycoside hydrolase family 43 n=2 Tax=Clostridium cellulovorans TaxID=1493 RepID=D9STE2_CLOC7|nr:glycoside hydrolase family 43 protein [Clostridium cellulovorans]ADL50758.1 glycoside hydrolase family 43 [Clostridium cellulovorans 743B]BAV13101.1 endo-1,4-beta-xylanase [Clostridium cellulovorans]